MPTYDYQCTKCNYEFEKFQKMTDKPLSICPKCKGSVKRLIGSGSGIIFKGSGFYATDYKKSSSASSSAPAKGKKCPNAGSGCQGCPASE